MDEHNLALITAHTKYTTTTKLAKETAGKYNEEAETLRMLIASVAEEQKSVRRHAKKLITLGESEKTEVLDAVSSLTRDMAAMSSTLGKVSESQLVATDVEAAVTRILELAQSAPAQTNADPITNSLAAVVERCKKLRLMDRSWDEGEMFLFLEALLPALMEEARFDRLWHTLESGTIGKYYCVEAVVHARSDACACEAVDSKPDTLTCLCIKRNDDLTTDIGF